MKSQKIYQRSFNVFQLETIARNLLFILTLVMVPSHQLTLILSFFGLSVFIATHIFTNMYLHVHYNPKFEKYLEKHYHQLKKRMQKNERAFEQSDANTKNNPEKELLVQKRILMDQRWLKKDFKYLKLITPQTNQQSQLN